MPVTFDSFRALNPEAADLVRDLIEPTAQQSAFASFSHLWMGFNGWMECVTSAPTDAAMINALATNDRLVATFDNLMRDAQFRQQIFEFANLWPVVDARDARRKIGSNRLFELSHNELAALALARRIKHQPEGWSPGGMPTWSHVLRTIYLVRCNLFHGSKSPRNYRDHELVGACDRILRMFIDRSGCLFWWDHRP